MIEDDDDDDDAELAGNINTYLHMGICVKASDRKAIWGSLDHSLVWKKEHHYA